MQVCRDGSTGQLDILGAMSASTGPAGDSAVVNAHGDGISIGPLRPDEHDRLFEVFQRVVEKGAGFPHAPPLTRETFDEVWTGPARTVIGARIEGELMGAYYLKPNFPGRAAHIANAGYVVAEAHRGRGIGRVLVEDSIVRAPLLGYDAIQFNLVFSSNPARVLYEQLGWREIGRVPAAVGGEDAVIYWRRVGD
jgi:GNAT superfamily N-acetyltransferase